MAKLWDWMRGSAKREKELAAARAAVETGQRALLPYAGALDAALRAELEQAERDWREACALAERDDAASQTHACEGFARIAENLGALRQRAVLAHPDLAGGELVARALEGLSTIENREQRCTAALELLSVVADDFDLGSLERVLAEERAGLIEVARLDQLVALVRVLDSAAKRGTAQGLGETRARAVQRLREWDPSDPEREGWLLALLETEAARGDLAAARAALGELEGETHDQGLQVLADALAHRGEFEEARAALASIRGEASRRQAELGLIDGLARADRIDEALLVARATEDDEARAKALARIAGIHAGKGEREAALALVAEIPEESREEARFELLEADLERRDYEAAVRELEEFTDDGFRSSALARVCAVLAHSADITYAQEFAESTEEPHLCAGVLETLGWRRLHERDEDGARALFARALEIAGEVARQGASARHPGRVGADWMILASRIQVALGDPRPALACVKLFDDDQRALGLREIGRACGGAADVTAVDSLLADIDTTFERNWLLCGAVRGLAGLGRATPERA